MTGPSAPVDTDYWVCGTNLDDDEPSFGDDYETREEALAGAITELTHVASGEPFQIGKVTKSFAAPTSPLHAGDVIEQASNGMHGVWISELCDGWETKAGEHVRDLQKRLDEAWTAWTEEHKLRIGVLALEDVETHIMPVRESDAADELRMSMEEP